MVIKSIIALSIFPFIACNETRNNANAEPAPAAAGSDTGGSEAAPSRPSSEAPANPSSAPAPKSQLLADGLAFGKEITASSICAATYPPENAVDGDPGSYWSSEFKDDAWLAVDLGEAKSVGRVTIRWERAYADAFSVQVSKDGQTWADVYETDDGKGGISEIKFPSAEARHIRLNCTKRHTSWGNAVSEIQVFE